MFILSETPRPFLNCSTEVTSEEDTVEWNEYVTTGSAVGVTSNGNSLFPRNYGVEGLYNLVVLNAEVSNGGVYQCIITMDGDLDITTADLILLGMPH